MELCAPFKIRGRKIRTGASIGIAVYGADAPDADDWRALVTALLALRRDVIAPRLKGCTAIDAVLARGRVGETYHVGSGIEASIMEVADRILAALGKPESLKTIVPDRPGHDRRYVLDSSKLRTELGWAPSVDWEQGLVDTVAWYAANRNWWEPLRARAPIAEGSWGSEGG